MLLIFAPIYDNIAKLHYMALNNKGILIELCNLNRGYCNKGHT